MISKDIKQSIESKLDSKIIGIIGVTGGDINNAILVSTSKTDYFVKYNSIPASQKMFDSEIEGLNEIRSSNTILTPDIIGVGIDNKTSFLILEYIKPGQKTNKFWKKFGYDLSEMHKQSDGLFGYKTDNYIGSLKQKNKRLENWIDFYIENRIRPQVKLAFDSGKFSDAVINQFETLFIRLETIFPVEPPALIHGDLWSGNFVANQQNEPVLIDPSVSFSHREMDLAMTMLFGRFSPSFYDAYNENHPLQPDFSCRIEIYQLYYLLVHVNLFGGMYILSVQNILNKWT